MLTCIVFITYNTIGELLLKRKPYTQKEMWGSTLKMSYLYIFL